MQGVLVQWAVFRESSLELVPVRWVGEVYTLWMPQVLAQAEDGQEGNGNRARLHRGLFMEAIWMWNLQGSISLCLQSKWSKIQAHRWDRGRPTSWQEQAISSSLVPHVWKEYKSNGANHQAKPRGWTQPWRASPSVQDGQRPRKRDPHMRHLRLKMPHSRQIQPHHRPIPTRGQPLQVRNPHPHQERPDIAPPRPNQGHIDRPKRNKLHRKRARSPARAKATLSYRNVPDIAGFTRKIDVIKFMNQGN